jgi:hypothetical protein
MAGKNLICWHNEESRHKKEAGGEYLPLFYEPISHADRDTGYFNVLCS